MYQIFEFAPWGKRLAFNGDKFETITAVETTLADTIAYFETDSDHDAADFITKGGGVYSVERVS
jgi:hypothetical protein